MKRIAEQLESMGPGAVKVCAKESIEKNAERTRTGYLH